MIGSCTIFLFGGIIGTMHHLYFSGTPLSVLALGAVFSALEVVPLTLVGLEAAENARLGRGCAWLAAYRWPLRFFGANLRFGYVFPFVPEPWRVSLSAGAYYTTMLIPDGKYGYLNLTGPQLYLTLRRAFANGDAVSLYAKFSPVTDQSAALSFTNREVGAGLAWSRPLGATHALSVGLDYAQIHFANLISEVRTSSWTLGAGYGF